MKTVCEICPRRCALEDGQSGFCRGRRNEGGSILCANYGRLTSLALDPIEKKPLRLFSPGGLILSAGSYGCNLRCPFCQNYEISMADRGVSAVTMSPPELVRTAHSLLPQGNVGIAFTYNEPLIGYEYVRDCAVLAHEQGLKNVVVTNGTICESPLRELLPLIDAWNIDLKGFTQEFYIRIGGDLDTVRQTIRLAAQRSHVEVTTLLIPGENDSEEEIRALSAWLAELDPDIPLHLSRFFPCYRMKDRASTPADTVCRLAAVAEERLNYVFTGNC